MGKSLLATVVVASYVAAADVARAQDLQTFTSAFVAAYQTGYVITMVPASGLRLASDVWGENLFSLERFPGPTQELFARECGAARCVVTIEGTRDPGARVITPTCLEWVAETGFRRPKECVPQRSR